MKVLLTGASGFIAHWIARELSLSGHQVTGAVRRVNSSSRYCIDEIIVENIFQPDSPTFIKNLSKFDAVMHCAWYVNPKDYLNSDKNFAFSSSDMLSSLSNTSNTRSAAAMPFFTL